MIERIDMEEVQRRLDALLARAHARESCRQITVNKKTHRIRFTEETEDSVTIIVEEKDKK
jgi:hypothetical protein